MALLSLQSSFLHPFASFPSNVVQQGTFLPRGGSLIRKPGSTGCPESRSGENGFWAGGGPRKILSRESGSRSYPGWLPILKEGAATSSGSSSASPPDVINHYKSALESAACGTYEPACWEPLRTKLHRMVLSNLLASIHIWRCWDSDIVTLFAIALTAPGTTAPLAASPDQEYRHTWEPQTPL